jgi:hypothetical protein
MCLCKLTCGWHWAETNDETPYYATLWEKVKPLWIEPGECLISLPWEGRVAWYVRYAKP